MTEQQKKLTLLALRNAAKILEEELEGTPPVLPKRRSKKSQFREHLEHNALLGTWGKPQHLKKHKHSKAEAK